MTKNEFRTSQGIVPFGVGAIVDFLDDTLMMAGLDVWPVAQPDAALDLERSTKVVDSRLAQRLSAEMGRKINHFHTPALAPEIGRRGMMPQEDRAQMPFVRFPRWHYCPICRRMKELDWNTKATDANMRCNNTVRRVPGKGTICGDKPEKFRPKLIPVRFIVACESGHIFDFPWERWVHKGFGCADGVSQLFFTSTTQPGTAGIRIVCKTCDEHRSLVGAFNRGVLADVITEGCPGERPWLGPDGREQCQHSVMQTIQRGASNAYFAKVAKSILIPPHSQRVMKALTEKGVYNILKALLPDPPQPTLDYLAKENGVEPAELLEGALALKDGSSGTVAITENAFRRAEYDAFTGPRPSPKDREDFDLRPVKLRDYGPWFEDHFEEVALVTRLRETRVLQGFARLLPPGANENELAPLSLGKPDWLPGVSVRGEGIFLRFRKSRLEEWVARATVQERFEQLKAAHNAIEAGMARVDLEGDVTKVLLHSFAHLLIRQLAFDSGYDSSSICERIYASDGPDGMAGVLLYTASGDSEGTLGGLVRQGRPEYLPSTVSAALENGRYCSSDPLCIESAGQGLNSLNLAACHACSLLPETSCEMSNMLLDRAVAVGHPSIPDLAFFGELGRT
ncbi:DUF1998 domain-containing protein [uncultured Tateyamaria sp.]|uniref:DUF1998 domain-containing protein n=1 Tax=uncultured Tateyamaria sp. TaxID=455651 RepID=UPI00263616FA|nr:DUF1998 domain-containing protein [uncultured Tateyamaria sp.]